MLPYSQTTLTIMGPSGFTVTVSIILQENACCVIFSLFFFFDGKRGTSLRLFSHCSVHLLTALPEYMENLSIYPGYLTEDKRVWFW